MQRRNFVTLAAGSFASALLQPDRVLAVVTDVAAVSSSGREVVLRRAEIEELRDSLAGSLLLNGESGYEQARHIWNGAFDRHPAVIVRCAGAADVRHAVQFAAQHELLLAVKGGGHSLPGHSVCDRGMMIDLSSMKGVRVDTAAKTARVEPGVLLGQIDREAQAFGLALPAGTVSHTGVAGLTLGGGFGRLTRTYGLTIDHMLSADVVTADGRLLKASAHENADLFWAIRGGGGNFGVVTSFEFTLRPLDRLLMGGDLIYSREDARDVLRFLGDYALDAPDEIWIDPVLEAEANDVHLLVNICHSGALESAEREIDRLRRFRKPRQDTIAPKSYVRLQSEHDHRSPHGRGYYMTGVSIAKLEPALIEHSLASIQEPGALMGKISFTQNGGAIARIPDDQTAFANRALLHNVVVRGSWDDRSHADARTAWGRSTAKGLQGFSKGLYANLSQADAQSRTKITYGGNLERLRALKRKYDPANLFRLNPNIEPA